MITAHTEHFLHPYSLQPPASSASVSHIELDATKSPLALLAQTCLQIRKSEPFSSTNSSEHLKITKFYSKSAEKKDSRPSPDSQRPFSICPAKIRHEDEKNETDGDKSSHESGNSEIYSEAKNRYERNMSSSETSGGFSASSEFGFCVPAFSALPLPVSAFPQPGLPALNTKPGTPIISTGLCRDPYCLGYYCSTSLKSTFPLLYPPHSLPSSSMSTFTLFPHPHELQSCIFNSVANSSETSFSSSVGSYTHIFPTLRNPHHTLGVAARYHPYFKSPLPTPSSSYYALHGLYGHRLHLAP